MKRAVGCRAALVLEAALRGPMEVANHAAGRLVAAPPLADGWVSRKILDEPLLQGNLGDAIPKAMAAAGLVDAREVSHVLTWRIDRVTI